MKKFLLVMVASLAVACGGDDNGNDDPAQEKCSSEGDQKCSADGTQRLVCDGTVYTVASTCAAPQVCTKPGAAAVVVCSAPVTPAGEFEECTGTGQGNCEDGLTCFNAGEGSVCVTTCDAADATSCGADRVCQQVTASVDICFGLAGRDEICLVDEAASVCEEGFECSPDVLGIPSCRLTCSGEEQDVQGSCPSGELCLGFDFVEPQPDNATCSNPGEQDSCDDGYTCLSVSNGTTTTDQCAREIAWCGTPAPLLTDVSSEGLADFDPETDVCGFPGAAKLCQGQGDANSECTQLPFGAPNQDAPCTVETEAQDCDLAAGETCVSWDNNGTPVSLCGVLYYGCLAFCDGPDGEALDCGEGFTCQDPGTAIDFVPQLDAEDDFVGCEGEDGEADDELCDEAAGNYCNEFTDGFYCIRNARICAPE